MSVTLSSTEPGILSHSKIVLSDENLTSERNNERYFRLWLSEQPYYYPPFSENSVSRRVDELFNAIKSVYYIDETFEVLNFLRENDFLINIIFSSVHVVNAVFGNGVATSLEIKRDPEEEYEELFIVIKSSYTAYEARERMSILLDYWFLDILDKTQGKLNILEQPL